MLVAVENPADSSQIVADYSNLAADMMTFVVDKKLQMLAVDFGCCSKRCFAYSYLNFRCSKNF